MMPLPIRHIPKSEEPKAASRELLVKVCDVPGGGSGDRALALCDRHGHPLPGQIAVDTRSAVGDGASITVTFLIDGAMVRWA